MPKKMKVEDLLELLKDERVADSIKSTFDDLFTKLEKSLTERMKRLVKEMTGNLVKGECQEQNLRMTQLEEDNNILKQRIDDFDVNLRLENLMIDDVSEDGDSTADDGDDGMNSLAKSTSSASTSSSVVNGNDTCRCAKGQIDVVSAFALQKTHSDNSKKTYVYVLDVRRSDGSEYKIHRRHSDLVGLANSLPRLKELAVQKNLKKTEVPKLPDRIERTKDLGKITKYLSSILLFQDENNAVSKALNKFCKQDPSCDTCCSEDSTEIISSDKKPNLKEAESRSALNISAPMALPSFRVTTSYKSDDKRQISLQKNTIVQIFKKCPSGWWYVLCREKSGWFPASYLEMIDSADDDETVTLETPERYKTTCDYAAQNSDELSFSANTIVNVSRKMMDGWWIAEYLGQKGFVPATYLRPCEMTATDCNDMCWQTMDMKLTPNRCCSEGAHLQGEEGKCKNGETEGIDLMPEEEIIREEDHTQSDSSVESIESLNLTISKTTVDISSNDVIANSTYRCEMEMRSSDRRTQL